MPNATCRVIPTSMITCPDIIEETRIVTSNSPARSSSYLVSGGVSGMKLVPAFESV